MMQCPQCKRKVSQDATACPHCGYGLIVLQSFNNMKDELGNISVETYTLSQKIRQMQKRLAQLETLVSHQVEKPVPKTEAITQQQARRQPSPPSPPRKKATMSTSRESEVTFGQKWLLIAGVVVTVLAVGWFLKYSFDQNWIGPAGRVAMAYLGGIAFLGVGEFFRSKKIPVFGLYLIGGGIATLYFATFAAFHIYHLIAHVPAFGIMILVTTVACILALVYDTAWLAVLGLIGGFLTPIILNTGVDEQVALMTYLVILNVGILSIAFFKQWRLLNYLGFFLTWFLFSGWYIHYYEGPKFWITTIFLNIFFLTYAFVPFAYHVLRQRSQHMRCIEILVPNAFIAFGYSFAMIKNHFSVEYVSIVTLAYAAIFLWMAHVIYNRDGKQVAAFVLLIGKATLFLVLTIPILFSEQWVTFFWAIQAVVLLWAALKLENRWLYGSFIIIMLLTLGKFFFYDYAQIFHLRLAVMYFRGDYMNLFLERYMTSAIILVAVFQSARLLAKKTGTGLSIGKKAAVWWGVSAVTLFLIMNIEVSAFFHDYAPQARFAATSVLWTLFSIVLMIFGFVKNRSSLRKCAIGLFAITMIKVFLVDMARVSTPYRVISFMVLGLMLIGASYLYYRFKKQILPPESKKGSAK
ncbi:MAG: DUF2339 domain-containing protein [Deltaproteobacteria bacterium]|nr:DUF2339 domain-containing protein [Deltaproteobacteria bacterium]